METETTEYCIQMLPVAGV